MNDIQQLVQDRLNRRYLNHVFKSKRGRAFFLAQLANAEDSDEAAVFDHLLAKVDNPDLQKVVRRHRDDEKRHGQMFRDCVAATGADPGPIPVELQILNRIGKHLDGLFEQPIQNEEQVMEAYVLLQVIEERAVTQFSLFAEVMEPYDAKAAATIRTVVRDEERHLKYCHAVARRYAPDQATHARALRRFRLLEAKAFAENSRANLRHILVNDLIDVSLLERTFWLGLAAFDERRGLDARTPFFHEGPVSKSVSPAELALA